MNPPAEICTPRASSRRIRKNPDVASRTGVSPRAIRHASRDISEPAESPSCACRRRGCSGCRSTTSADAACIAASIRGSERRRVAQVGVDDADDRRGRRARSLRSTAVPRPSLPARCSTRDAVAPRRARRPAAPVPSGELSSTMMSSPSSARRAYAAKIASHEIGQPIALVVRGNDDGEPGRGRRAASCKDRTRKHYNSSIRLSDMTNRLFAGARRASCSSCVCRRSSQPMGADQGLYAYVGERILRGDAAVPRRVGSEAAGDPPRLRGDARRLAARLGRRRPPICCVAALVAVLLVGARRGARRRRRSGRRAALLFLLLSNPAFARLGGVAVRAQCETFIARGRHRRVGSLLARGRDGEPDARTCSRRGSSARARRSRSSTTRRSTSLAGLACARRLGAG